MHLLILLFALLGSVISTTIPVPWATGMTPHKINAAPGDIILWKWTEKYTVANCTLSEFSRCSCSNIIASESPFSWEVPKDSDGPYFFASSVGKHCTQGVQLVVTVSKESDDTKTVQKRHLSQVGQQNQTTQTSSNANMTMCYSPCYYTWYNFCENLWYNMTTFQAYNPNYDFTSLCVESPFDVSMWPNYSTPWSNYNGSASSLPSRTTVNNNTHPCFTIWFNSTTDNNIPPATAPAPSSSSCWTISMNTTTQVQTSYFNTSGFCYSPCFLDENLPWAEYGGFFQGVPCNADMTTTSAWLNNAGYWLNETSNLCSYGDYYNDCFDSTNPCFQLWLSICYNPWLSSPTAPQPESTPVPEPETAPAPEPETATPQPGSSYPAPQPGSSNSAPQPESSPAPEPSPPMTPCNLWKTICYPWFTPDFTVAHPWFNLTEFYDVSSCDNSSDVDFYMNLWYNLTYPMYNITKPDYSQIMPSMSQWINTTCNSSYVNVTSNNMTNLFYNFCFNPCMNPCSNNTNSSAPEPTPSPASTPEPEPSPAPIVPTGPCYEDCYNPCYYTWWDLCYGLWHNQTYYNLSSSAYNFTTLCNYSSPWTNLTGYNNSESESIIQASLCWNMWYNTTSGSSNITADNSTSGSSNITAANSTQPGEWYNVTAGWLNVAAYCDSPCTYGLMMTGGSWSNYNEYSIACTFWNWDSTVSANTSTTSTPWLDFSNPCFDFWLDICYVPWTNNFTVPSPQPTPSTEPSPESSPEPEPSPESSPQPVPSSEYSPEPVPSPESSFNCSNVCYDLWYFVCYNPHNKTMFDDELFACRWDRSHTRPWMHSTPTTPCYDPWFSDTNIYEFTKDWCDAARRLPNPFYDTVAFGTYISQCYNTPMKPELPCFTDQPESNNVIVNSQ